MKRLILFACLVGMPFAIACAGDIRDLNGTWIRDLGKSDALATDMDGDIKPVSADLIIKLEGAVLQVETKWDYKPSALANYALDGNEHRSASEGGNTGIYRCFWDRDKLIIEETINANTPFGNAEIKHKYEWAVSNEAATLTITTLNEGTPFGGISSRKQVYHRQASGLEVEVIR
jgi:hypothetical protein